MYSIVFFLLSSAFFPVLYCILPPLLFCFFLVLYCILPPLLFCFFLVLYCILPLVLFCFFPCTLLYSSSFTLLLFSLYSSVLPPLIFCFFPGTLLSFLLYSSAFFLVLYCTDFFLPTFWYHFSCLFLLLYSPVFFQPVLCSGRENDWTRCLGSQSAPLPPFVWRGGVPVCLLPWKFCAWERMNGQRCACAAVSHVGELLARATATSCVSRR